MLVNLVLIPLLLMGLERIPIYVVLIPPPHLLPHNVIPLHLIKYVVPQNRLLMEAILAQKLALVTSASVIESQRVQHRRRCGSTKYICICA